LPISRISKLVCWAALTAAFVPPWAKVQLAAQAPSALIRVTSQQQQLQTVNYVTVRFELQNPTSAVGLPNFKVQLDGGDPVVTASTERTFTGLTPGQHVMTVQLVDANGTQIPNSQTQVQFVVLPTAKTGGAAGPQKSGNSGGPTANPVPQVAQPSNALNEPQIQQANSLPQGSLVPVISVIGFGVLFGGIVSALKTRP